MLTAEENERLTRVGSGTPMGDLFRRYWQPIAAVAQLDENPVKAVRLFGEDLTLFKDKKGRLGLIADRCAHRHVKLVYGIPEEEGLRCCYHGWMYDRTGQCIEQPAEPADSRFKDKIKIKIKGYPVEELAGMVFAYLGPEPTPVLPKWDRLAWEGNILRLVSMTSVPCNWLQTAENYPDFCHSEYLHGWYSQYMLERKGLPKDDPVWLGPLQRINRHQQTWDWDRFEHGIITRILMADETKDDDLWRIGQPMVFPNTALITSGNSFSMQWAVPMDDTHTLLMSSQTYRFSPEVQVPKQEQIPYYEYPWDMKDENGEPRLDIVSVQDNLIFVAQGEIADRTAERLGDIDRGIILYRQVLKEQIEIVADGGQPMNVFRDPERAQCIPLPAVRQYYARGRAEDGTYQKGAATAMSVTRYGPIADTVEALFEEEARVVALKGG